MDCIFCKIASKAIPATLIYDDDQIVAFHDNAPRPRRIFYSYRISTSLLSTNWGKENSDLISHMILTATQLAKDLSLADDGYRLVWNCNRQGGQAVYHIHLHLLGGRNMHWPPG